MQDEVTKFFQLHEDCKKKFLERVEEYRAVRESNLSKQRILKKTYDIFFKSDDNQIRDCNRVMLTCEEAMMQNYIMTKGLKPDNRLLQDVYTDFNRVFERMQHDQRQRPEIVNYRFIGRDVSGTAYFRL